MEKGLLILCTICGLILSRQTMGIDPPKWLHQVADTCELMATGRFEPTWESLQNYQTPEWFRDAKFGIWAHWGPQCQPEAGDWYARGMYEEGRRQYQYHREHYGPQSEFGFKDIIPLWKAEKWNPEALLKLYKKTGAKYFVALANHHDNMDLWNSKYQPWNSVNLGPRKDLIEGWAKACKAHGLRFGVSVHASHAWTWYEVAQRADKAGEYAGIPYDGKLTRTAGKGLWWEGYDPQDLYAQNHPLSAKSNVSDVWNWTDGFAMPDDAYCNKFYNRTIELLNKYQPDLIYFDDTALPLYPISDAGLKIAAHFYNANSKWHNGKNEAVITGKILDKEQRKTMIYDIERGASGEILPQPWQTCTCLGSWHYDRSVYDRNKYKNSATVIRMLADIVSKNGNLLLSIPLRGDGSVDEKELVIVEKIGKWMKVNGEAIYATRPWRVFGEGPTAETIRPLKAQGFNEGARYSAADVRYTAKGKNVYAIVLGRPDKTVSLKSFAKTSGLNDRKIRRIELLGSKERVKWVQGKEALNIEAPQCKLFNEAVVYKIVLQ